MANGYILYIHSQYIYIFIHTKCSNNKKMISNNKDALSVYGALLARRLKWTPSRI